MSIMRQLLSSLLIGLCTFLLSAGSLFSHTTGRSSNSVLFLVPQMNLGGTEKAFIDMVQFLPRPLSRYDVCVLEPGGALENSLPPGPHYISFHTAKKRKYAAVVSYAQWIPPKLWTRAIRARRRIQWCHVDLATIGIGFPLQTAKGRRGIDLFVAVSKAATRSIISLDKKLRNKAITIHNCVNEKAILKKASEPQDLISSDQGRLNLITVGRLAPEKGIDRAIRVHKRLHQEGFRFHWYFVGEGSLKSQLQEMVKREGLENYVHFLGLKTNPYPYVRAADIFVLCSHSESWGLVVSEAMILHKPIVSTNLGGVCEQIKSGINGLIVDNSEEGLYGGIQRILRDEDMRRRFSKALETFHYDNKSITAQLNRLLFSKHSVNKIVSHSHKKRRHTKNFATCLY